MSLLGDTIPIELMVRDRPCVVVGAGEEAAAKIDRLLRSGALVTWFRQGEGVLEQEGGREGLTLAARPFEDADASRAAVVFLTSEHEAIGARLAQGGRLVCTLDRPLASTFVNPAVAERSGLRVSVSTGGTAPALASRLREELERLLDSPELERFVREMSEERRALAPGRRSAPMRERALGVRIEGRIVVPGGSD